MDNKIFILDDIKDSNFMNSSYTHLLFTQGRHYQPTLIHDFRPNNYEGISGPKQELITKMIKESIDRINDISFVRDSSK
jgi:hypothetical protein